MSKIKQRFPDNWDLESRINYLQRKIILNSIAYYLYDTNFIPDWYYNAIAHQLAEMHTEYGDISKTNYGYAFSEFDGSTGFDIYYRLKKKDREYLTGLVRYQVERRSGGDSGGS